MAKKAGCGNHGVKKLGGEPSGPKPKVKKGG